MGYPSHHRKCIINKSVGCDNPVSFKVIELEEDYKSVFGDKKVKVSPSRIGSAMNGWKIQGYWYKHTRKFLNDLALKSICWCKCAKCSMCAVEEKKDRRSVSLSFSGRKSFGGDFHIVFRADRPDRVYYLDNDGSLRRIMTHEPIKKFKSIASRSAEEKKDGKGEWLATSEDGTTMIPDSSWPRGEFSSCPAFEKYDSPDGKEPPIFGPSIPPLDEIAEKIRLSLGDGELRPEDIAEFIAKIKS